MQKVPAFRPGLSDLCFYVVYRISVPALTAKVKVETKIVCVVEIHILFNGCKCTANI